MNIIEAKTKNELIKSYAFRLKAYNISFKYSFVISFYLILFNKLIREKKNYFTKLFMTSLIAFLASVPIQINNFFSIT